jgi:hypothetical protein
LPTRKRSASPLLSTAFFGASMSRLFTDVIQIWLSQCGTKLLDVAETDII